MTTSTAVPDLRPALAAAQEWVAALIDGVGDDQLRLPTPCPDFDVAQLIGHLYTGADRVRVMAEGGDALTVPFIGELPGDGIADGYRSRTAAAQRAWAERADLSAPVRAPWGEVPAAAAIGNYLSEALAHGWDLAVATGQPAEADPALVEPALQAARRGIPAELRGQIPFGPVIEPADDATPTERFVNWMGRDAGFSSAA
ncbi:TIGR03086 family metal-binding protein [Microlunatus soli]|uniref:TIGR03086 family protein n=1 Tax=Microlunatus soli TaxID=630515 RepID=A0A1H1RPV5_9ACTN|nr:TIGR03086 family metal-binding protein [Microlunatus soli]SDS37703.1 TIGR03086 family protein [Microlunatus soli]